MHYRPGCSGSCPGSSSKQQSKCSRAPGLGPQHSPLPSARKPTQSCGCDCQLCVNDHKADFSSLYVPPKSRIQNMFRGQIGTYEATDSAAPLGAFPLLSTSGPSPSRARVPHNKGISDQLLSLFPRILALSMCCQLCLHNLLTLTTPSTAPVQPTAPNLFSQLLHPYLYQAITLKHCSSVPLPHEIFWYFLLLRYRVETTPLARPHAQALTSLTSWP